MLRHSEVEILEDPLGRGCYLVFVETVRVQSQVVRLFVTLQRSEVKSVVDL